jgi:hypothetical protein
MTETQQDLVLHLLREGDWQDAILAYAEEAGVSHEEATEAVEALAASEHIARHPTWRPALLALGSLVSLIAVWMLARTL